MEEVIETYTAPHDPHHPVICFDESPFQLLRHVADPRPASPGVARREDYEYERAGVADVMMICQPALGLRKCLVTQSRKKVDFAGVCAEIDRMFPRAASITLVRINLNTLALEVLLGVRARKNAPARPRVQLCPHAKARLVAEHRRDRVGGAGQDGLQKRIGDTQTLQTELDALYGSPNPRTAPVRWQFNLGKAHKEVS